MFAIIKSGGKQYKASQNAVLKVEKITGEPGESITFKDILAICEDTGKLHPVSDNAAVHATILDVRKSKKIIVFKKKRRKDYQRLKGHRQWQTVVRISSFSGFSETSTMDQTAAQTEPSVAQKSTTTENKKQATTQKNIIEEKKDTAVVTVAKKVLQPLEKKPEELLYVENIQTSRKKTLFKTDVCLLPQQKNTADDQMFFSIKTQAIACHQSVNINP